MSKTILIVEDKIKEYKKLGYDAALAVSLIWQYHHKMSEITNEMPEIKAILEAVNIVYSEVENVTK